MFFGILAAGGVFTGSNPSYTVFEFVHQSKFFFFLLRQYIKHVIMNQLTYMIVKLANAKFLVVEKEFEENAREAAKQVGGDIKILVIGESFDKLYNHTKELDWKRITDRKILENRVSLIMFSSGTTGLSKGVMITDRNVVSNAEQRIFFIKMRDEELRKEGKPVPQKVGLGYEINKKKKKKKEEEKEEEEEE